MTWMIRVALVVACLTLTLGNGFAEATEGSAGAVYTETNSPAGNVVLVFDRAADGALTAAGAFSTGGFGTGGGLGNQGAVVLTENERWLIVVNAASHDVSVFAAEANGLRHVGNTPSGGRRPISVAVHGKLVYVLNAGGAVGDADNITGFVLDDGYLTPLAGSTRPLSGNATGPAQVAFRPDGRVLVVTEKTTNTIDTYTVGQDGMATGPNVSLAAHPTPFGFAFGKRDQVFVSEAGGGPDASAVSSYLVADDGGLQVITPAAATTETAACWVVVTPDGRFAYTTNTGSGSISGYRIAFDGELSLLDEDGRTGVTGAGSRPIDMALSRDGRFVYTLNSGNGTLSAFSVRVKGSLSPRPGVLGIPAGSNGLAAR